VAEQLTTAGQPTIPGHLTMAGHLVRLKVELLKGALRAGSWQVVGTVIAYLAAVGGCLAVLALGVALRTASAERAGAIVVVLGSVLVLGWTVLPLLAFGVDETLDPARFAVLPVRGRQLVPGLTVAGLVGAPGLVATTAGAASVLVWTRSLAAVLIAVPAAALGVLTCVAASRLVTTSLARVLSGRRARDATSLLAVLVVAAMGMLPMLGIAFERVGLQVATIAAALSWTPLGTAWAVPADAATGHPAACLGHLVMAFAVLAAAVLGWARMLDRQLTQPPITGGERTSRIRRSLLDRVPPGPTWAVAGRSLVYLRRDPRYVAALIGPAVAVVFPLVVAVVTPGQRAVVVVIGPLAALLTGLVGANDIGYDGSAFAAHIVTAVPGRADRTGRAMALLAWAVPVATVATAATCIVGRQPRLIPALLGVSLAALLGAVGGGAVSGALAPFPMPEAGTNPFRANSGATGRAMLAQLGVSSVAVAAAVPAVVATLAALVWWAPLLWLALFLGPATGAAVLVAGLSTGGRIVDARSPEILAAVRRHP